MDLDMANGLLGMIMDKLCIKKLIILFINSVHWKLNIYSHLLNINMNKSTDSQLLIDAIRQKYPDNTGQYLFKSCGKKWIVILEKLDDTITNQHRLPLDDPNRQFAKYRADKLMVVNIIHKFNPNKTINKISNSYHKNHTVEYIKGNTVIPNSFDQDMDKVCSSGIHFYGRIEPAFYLELKKVENGKWTQWYDNGQKSLEGEYLNGENNGKWTKWYENGQIESEGEYLNGEINGKYTFWYGNGQKSSEAEYLNGKQNSKWTFWYYNGQKSAEGEYVNGEKNGKWTEWYSNKQKSSEGEYLNGKQNGKWTTWYDNGQIKSKREYLNGEKNGKWSIWNKHGQKIKEREFLNGKLTY